MKRWFYEGDKIPDKVLEETPTRIDPVVRVDFDVISRKYLAAFGPKATRQIYYVTNEVAEFLSMWKGFYGEWFIKLEDDDTITNVNIVTK